MPLSLYFMKEKIGNYKNLLKNRGFEFPLIYYKGLKIEIEICNNESIEEFYGESGRIIENFICKDKFIINQLYSNFIFGEFFSMDYFSNKNFSKLITAVKLKLEKLGIKNNEENNHSHKAQKVQNKIYEEKISNLDSDIQVGDVILDLDVIRREKALTEKEKKEREKQAFLKRKKYIEDLKKRKMNNK